MDFVGYQRHPTEPKFHAGHYPAHHQPSPRYMPYPTQDTSSRPILPPVSSVVLPPPATPHSLPHPQPTSLPLPHPHYAHLPAPYPAYPIKTETLSPPQPSPQDKSKQSREQLRKVSHSAIERRRRERINDKILQLKNLVPSCANQENLHKLSILQNAIDYIRILKSQLEEKESLPQQQQLQEQSPISNPEHSPRSIAHPSPPQAPNPSSNGYESSSSTSGSVRRPSICSLPSPAKQPLDLEEEIERRDEVEGLLMLAGVEQRVETAGKQKVMSVGSLLC